MLGANNTNVVTHWAWCHWLLVRTILTMFKLAGPLQDKQNFKYQKNYFVIVKSVLLLWDKDLIMQFLWRLLRWCFRLWRIFLISFCTIFLMITFDLIWLFLISFEDCFWLLFSLWSRHLIITLKSEVFIWGRLMFRRGTELVSRSE